MLTARTVATVGRGWSGRLDSNQRSSAPKADAIPGFATPRPPDLTLALANGDAAVGREGAHLRAARSERRLQVTADRAGDGDREIDRDAPLGRSGFELR